jgi:dihydrofolate reductase
VQTATKYVASNTLTAHAWGPSVFLSGDVAGRVAALKRQPGPDLHVYGSANLLQTLFAHDLVDALWLRIHPITLGRGKRLFDGRRDPGGVPAHGERGHVDRRHPASYERAGAIPTDRG